MIQEKKVYVEGIPCLQITSGEMPKGVVLFYHGWSSQKEYQAVRGHVLAAYGYDVLIPDAVNHGERGTIDYNAPSSYSAFWQTIFQNLREVPMHLKYMASWRPGVPLAVMGHSMGGFTSLGVMTHYNEFCTAVALNGSGWWDESERRFRAALHIDKPRSYPFLQRQLQAMDPYLHTQRLAGRSVLALNGGADDVVDNHAQDLYMAKLRNTKDVDCKWLTYDGLGHFVTTNMMGDAVDWLDEKVHR